MDLKDFTEFKGLSEEEKQLWQFERLGCIPEIKTKLDKMEKKVNYIYAWAAGVAAMASLVIIFVKNKFFKE